MNWFRSLKAVLLLSFIALLSLLIRSYADTRFILAEDFAHQGRPFIAVWILGYTAIVGGWVWALAASAGGGRLGPYFLFGYALVCAVGFGALSLLQFANFPEEAVIFTASLVAGTAACASIGLHLSHRREHRAGGNG